MRLILWVVIIGNDKIIGMLIERAVEAERRQWG